MKIIILGNVSSGKSTFIKALRASLFRPSCEIKIDDFRKTFGDGSKEGELVAQKEFLKAIPTLNKVSLENYLIELTGYGTLAIDLYSRLRLDLDIKYFVVLLAKLEVVRERTEQNLDQKLSTPVPTSYGSLGDTIELLNSFYDKKKVNSIGNHFRMQKYLSLKTIRGMTSLRTS
jgi:hypothetical protein